MARRLGWSRMPEDKVLPWQSTYQDSNQQNTLNVPLDGSKAGGGWPLQESLMRKQCVYKCTYRVEALLSHVHSLTTRSSGEWCNYLTYWKALVCSPEPYTCKHRGLISTNAFPVWWTVFYCIHLNVSTSSSPQLYWQYRSYGIHVIYDIFQYPPIYIYIYSTPFQYTYSLHFTAFSVHFWWDAILNFVVSVLEICAMRKLNIM